MVSNDDQNTLQNLKKTINFYEKVSFITANLVIFIIFCKIFEITYSENFYLMLILYCAVFVGGLFLSAILIKTKWFLYHKSSSDKHEEVWDFGIGNAPLRYKIPAYLHFSFFNILNDLFLVIIVWVAYIGFLTLIGLVILISPPTYFFGVVSVIGIFAGLFQFYLQYYREKITNQIMSSFSQNFKNILSKISYAEFLKYIKNKNFTLYEKIVDKKREKFIGGYPILMRLERSRKLAIALPYKPDEDYEIKITEMILDELRDDYKEKYMKLCEEFFKEKLEDIKKDLKKLDLTPIKREILGNLYLYEELESMVFRLEYALPERKEKPESYFDYLNNAMVEIMKIISELGRRSNDVKK